MRESSGVASNLADLPSGGGGVSPLGDRFQPDLVRGTGNYAVPLHLPRGPNELQPSFQLSYSTGAGDGAFGLGWNLGTFSIERRTDRGVPNYTDEDGFVLASAGLLVPVGDGRYRPEADNLFWDIRRDGEGWRIRRGDGSSLRLGTTPESRESLDGRVFAWRVDEELDAAGNAVRYTYRRDGNRLYLDEVHYSIFRLKVIHEPRGTALVNGRAGFPRHTRLRARRLELHCDRLSPSRMRAYELTYAEADNGASLLTSVRLAGTRTVDGDTEVESFPALRFRYADANPEDWRVEELRSRTGLPALRDGRTQLVDLDGNGLPDLLRIDRGRPLKWVNEGHGTFGGPVALDALPASIDLERPNVAFADLNGNGRVDLFTVDDTLDMVFESDGRGGFDPEPVVFASRPSVRLADRRTRLLDFDGDGVVDIVATEPSHHLMFRHEPSSGFQAPVAVARVRDLRLFPDVSFGDPGVRIADMTGDGLQDIVLVRSGRLGYWANLGHGRWSERIEPERAPVLPAGFREERLFLIDIDGSGCADLVYVDADRILVWRNRRGNAFADAIELPIGSGHDTRVLAADVFGDGRPALVWSAPRSVSGASGTFCLRFGTSTPPQLLVEVDNGMGGRFEVEYGTSTEEQLRDRDEGRPGSALPMAVHVVTEIRSLDTVTGRNTVQRMQYHEPVYDGPEREFRGFREVDVINVGDHSCPTTRQTVTLFQGDPEHSDLVERRRQRALAGALIDTAIFVREPDGSWRLTKASMQSWNVRVEHEGSEGTVLFPFLERIATVEHGVGDPNLHDATRYLDFDEFGNPGRRVRESHAEGEPAADWVRSEERFTYTRNEADWLVKLPVRAEYRGGDGELHSVQVRYYDGDPHAGLAEGQATRGLPTRAVESRLFLGRLPADYVGGRDFAALGYVAFGTGETEGWYATTLSVRRDAHGNIVEQRNPLGHPVVFEYDADGVYPIRSRDVDGNETRMRFEPRSGEPELTEFPDGRSVRYAFDALGRLQASYETDAGGTERMSKCWFVEAGPPFAIVSVVPAEAGAERSDFGLATLANVTGATVSKQFYDGFGQEAQQVTTGPDDDAGGRRFIHTGGHEINPRGLVSRLRPPEFVADLEPLSPSTISGDAPVRHRYDGDSNLVDVAGPGTKRFRQMRDTFSVRHYHGAAAGAFGAPPIGAPVRTERFDSRGRLTEVAEHNGAETLTTRYRLGVDGKLIELVDAEGHAALRYVFAGPGDPIRIDHRDLGRKTYYFDAAGNLIERVEPDGDSLLYEYDLFGRPTQIRHDRHDGNPAVLVRELIYDADPGQSSTGRFLRGRLAVLREGAAELRFSYTPGGRTAVHEVTVAGETLRLEREYDHQGRMRAIVYPDGHRLEYELDDSGAVRRIAGIAEAFRYEADGAVVGYRLSNGVEVEAPRDPATGQLTALHASRGGTSLRRIDYGYDEVGAIDAIRDETPDDVEHQRYRYDGLFRLAAFDVFADEAETAVVRQGRYEIDAVGNLARLEETAPLQYQYGDAGHAGRLTGVTSGASSLALHYNARGHVRAMGELSSIEYDAFDRAVRFDKNDGVRVDVAYDHRNRRVLKEVRHGGFVVQRSRFVLGLYEQHGTHALRHVFMGNSMIASERVEGGATSRLFYMADHLGTLLLATDDSGNVVGNQRYSPFGASWSASGEIRRFLGRSADEETGLVHLGARYYSPRIGRFISGDWYVLENPGKPHRIPQGYNVYSYALNNPLAFKDPSGLFVFVLVGVLAYLAVAALVVTAAVFAVGFIAGLVAGLSRGEGWGSLLTALETALTTTFGFWLGGITGFLVGGPVGFVVGAAMGGMNGLIGGMMNIYDWGDWRGWAAFLSDSTWGLVGTTLGNVVHIVNLFWPNSNYNYSLSARQNRHVYEGGMYVKNGFAFAMGNVISNAAQNGAGVNLSFLANHEELHIWQSRIFGPLFQTTYVVWAVGGFIVANIVWLTDTSQDWGSLVETAAYYDNPFEYWAYKNDNNWPPAGADPALTW
jgi:RHS repeat-associated protein